MLRLRNLLLHNYLYYIILLIAILYFLMNFIFIKKESSYQNDNYMEVIITNIVVKEYGIKLELKGKEKIVGFYYLREKEKRHFLNNYSIGDTVEINYVNKRVTNNTIENTFNYKKYLYNNNIYKVIEVNNIEIIKKNKNYIYLIKNMLLKRSQKLVNSYPYIYSLLFAENSYLDDIYVDSYRENGISHLFAISGSHIAIYIFMLQLILKKFKIKETKRYILIILFLIFYMFITNFSISVVRASLFTCLAFINTIYYLHIESKNLLLLTLSIIIFFNPLSVLDVGLQYSFTISLTLILMKKYLEIKKGYFRKLVYISFLSFITSIPITIYNFYQINFLTIVNNLFFVPYVSFVILPLVFLSYLFPALDGMLYFFIKIMNEISLFLSNINLFKLSFCKPSLSIIVVYFLSIFFFFFQLKKGKKIYVIFLIVLIIINNIWFLKNDNYLTFLDVGQGDSIALSVNDTFSLIDTGGIVMPSYSKYTYNLTKNETIPYLRSIGVKKINNLILTHGDVDHMKKSISLIKNIKIDNIYFNGNEYNDLEKEVLFLAKKKKIKVINLKEKEYINLNGVKLYSLNKDRGNENDSSIVLYFIINNYKVLLTGDISKEVELELLTKYNLNDITILKLAHHGSKTSSDYKFLKDINPKYSIISAGFNNKFNHPSEETIRNLEKLNLNYLETTKYGSITFNFKTGTFSFCYP